MYKNKKIIAIIPARAGSKGLPGKNIKILNGKPLISWSIEQAEKSTFLDKIVVSSDSLEVLDVAKRHRKSQCILRPNSLALDDSPMFDALKHALNSVSEEYDAIILLEPTSPLRKDSDIDKGIKALIDNWDCYDSVISLGKVHLENPEICKSIKSNLVKPYNQVSRHITARQQLNDVYFPYGVFYGSKVKTFLRYKGFYQESTGHFLIDRWQNYEIDDIYDFLCVESVMNYTKLYKDKI